MTGISIALGAALLALGINALGQEARRFAPLIHPTITSPAAIGAGPAVAETLHAAACAAVVAALRQDHGPCAGRRRYRGVR